MLSRTKIIGLIGGIIALLLLVSAFISLSQYNFNVSQWYQGTLVQLGLQQKPKIATLASYKTEADKKEPSSTFKTGEEITLAVQFKDLSEFKTINVRVTKEGKEEVEFMKVEVPIQGTGERFVALSRNLTPGTYKAYILDNTNTIDTISFEVSS